ncbi:MAG: DM13 domain-containing protein [Kribbellaceae bacterium]
MPRPSRRTVIAVVASVAAVGLAVGLPLFQPWRLFTNTVVDESLPGSPADAAPTTPAPTSTAPGTDMSPSMPQSSTRPPTVSAGPVTLARGTFITHEHDTTGTAAVIRLADGSRVLRLEGLDTSDGPDLEVWLTDAEVVEGTRGWRVFDDGTYVDLGDLKGNQGNQNYAIPADVDLSKFRSVSIWCDRFNVSFGAAALATA